MRPLFVLGAVASTWLAACGPSEKPHETLPERTPDRAGGGPTDAGSERNPGGRSREAGAGAEDALGCQGQRVEVREIADGTVSTGTDVELESVVATSQKFLVAKSSSGSCLWGMFVSADAASAAELGGVMIASYGAPAAAAANAELEPCVPGADAIPDDVAIGDLLSIRGKTEIYRPTWCANASPLGQIRVRALPACPVKKLGSTTPPAPVGIDLETANQLARGTDAQVSGGRPSAGLPDGASLQALASVVVRLTGVSGKRDGTSADIVGAYGTIRLNETELEVRDKISFGSVGSVSGGTDKSPKFAFPTAFSRIDGLVFLEYCDWVLAPRDKCKDYDPPSADCQ